MIDDDKIFVDLMVGALRDCGHDVTFAFEGHTGSKLAQSHIFDVVICDLVMPEKEGLETIKDLRRDQPDLAILAVSGGLAMAPHIDVLHIANKFGADLTLCKPFKLRQLADAVDKVLVLRRAARRERVHFA